MQTMISLSVLFVSKDDLYTKAMTLILKRIFNVKEVVHISNQFDLQIKRQLISPDIVLIDLETFDADDLETIRETKTAFASSLIAVIKNADEKLSPDIEVGNIILKSNFTHGFSELMANNLVNAEENKKTSAKKGKKNNFTIFFS